MDDKSAKQNTALKSDKSVSSLDKFISFLETKRVPNKNYHTYGNLNPGKMSAGIFEVNSVQKKLLFDHYQLAMANDKHKGILGITETPEEYGYLRLDFDFRWKYNSDQPINRSYTEEMILKIIAICRTIIEDICINLSDDMLICLLLEKPKPREEKGEIKDGFHLRFPHFIIPQEIGDKYFREQLISRIENQKIFDELHTSNDTKSIVDPVMKKAWLLYGSAKNTKAGYWKLKKSYDHNNKELTLQEAFPVALHKISNPPEYYLPSLLSVRYTKQPKHAELKKGLIIVTKKEKVKTTYTESNRSTETVIKDLAWIEASNIMDLLSDERCDDFNNWLEIGFTLYCIGQGHPSALNIWKEWSEGSERYIEGCCEKQWVKMVDRNKSIGSLKYYAKLDSPEKYATLLRQHAETLIDDALKSNKPTHMGIARIIHKLYSDRFKCTDSKHNIWREFRHHVWKKLDEGHTIKMIIVNDIRKLFYDNYTSLKSPTFEDNGDDDEVKSKINKKCKKILNVVEALDGTSFIEGVMRGCKILFYDEEYDARVNTNKDLYAFQNGVYDLKLNIFRQGIPDDYISMQSPINYLEPTEDELKKVQKWLRQLFPNPNIRKYWVRTHSTIFQGGNRDKKIWMNTGAGWAGKSGVESAMEKIHGQYSFKIPAEMLLLNDSSSSQGPSVALNRARNRRLLMTEEIGVNQQLNMGLLKKWSGGDSLYARSHHEEGGEFDPEFKFEMYLNEPPRIPSKDKALFTRIRLIDYVSRFGLKDDGTRPPENEDEQFEQNHFPANPSFKEEELPALVEPLAWFLLQDWPNYQKEGYWEPEEVTISTSKYEKINDTFMQFIDDKLCNVVGEKADKSMITMTEMQSAFNDWFKEQYPSYKNTYGKTKIRDEVTLKFRPPNEKGKWVGARFKIENEAEPPPKDINLASKKMKSG